MIKRLILSLAAVCLLAFGPTVGFSSVAAGEDLDGAESKAAGTITIYDVTIGQTYTAYRLFDIVEKENGGVYYYATAEQVLFYTEKGCQMTFTPTKDADLYTVSLDDIDELASDDDELIRELVNFFGTLIETEGEEMIAQGLVVPCDSEHAVVGTEEIVLTDLPYGYYYVTGNVGALVTVYGDAEIEIYDKQETPSLSKSVYSEEDGSYGTQNEAAIGDYIMYDCSVTTVVGASNYVMHEWMTDSLTLDISTIHVAAVTEDGTEYYVFERGVDYEVWVCDSLEGQDPDTGHVQDGCTFELLFYPTWLDPFDEPILVYVTYSVYINENAVVGYDAYNQALLDYFDPAYFEYDDPEYPAYEDPDWSSAATAMTTTRIVARQQDTEAGDDEETDGTSSGTSSGSSTSGSSSGSTSGSSSSSSSSSGSASSSASSSGSSSSESSSSSGTSAETSVAAAENSGTQTTEEGTEGAAQTTGGAAGSTNAQAAEILPQTGQLKWPVPVLSIIGILLILAGIYLCSREEDEEKPSKQRNDATAV